MRQVSSRKNHLNLLETKKMTNNFSIQAVVFANINAAEAAIGNLKGANKENTAAANSAKIGAYAELISSLAGVKLVKGNLPRAVSKQVRDALLQDAGVSEPIAKRYLENSVGAVNKLDIPSQATPDLVREILEAENITSERKLAERVHGTDDKDAMRALAEQLVGKFTTRKDENGDKVQGIFKASKFDQSDWDNFDDAVRELKAARVAAMSAAAAAEAEAAAENALANEVFGGATACKVSGPFGGLLLSSFGRKKMLEVGLGTAIYMLVIFAIIFATHLGEKK
jgi:hypothetical protein